MHSISLGAYAGYDITGETNVFTFTSILDDSKPEILTEMRTTITDEEYKVLKNVIERATKNKREISTKFVRAIIN